MKQIRCIKKITQFGVIVETYKNNGVLIFTRAFSSMDQADLYISAINEKVKEINGVSK